MTTTAAPPRTTTSHLGGQRFSAWCGVLFVVAFFPGMLMAGLFPPHSPTDTAAEVATAWSTDPVMRQFGIFTCMLAAGLQAPMAAVLSSYLKRIDPSHTYSNLQLIGGATAVVAILVPMFIWAAAAFRPESPRP